MSHQEVLGWLVPALLSLIGFFLQRIAKRMEDLAREIGDVGKALAITVTKQQDLERRVDRCEAKLENLPCHH